MDSCSTEGQPSSICAPNKTGNASHSIWAIPGWTSPKERSTVFVDKQIGSKTDMRYAIIIEKSRTGYGAFVPDLPGCVAVGESFEETETLIREAIELHLDGMKEDAVEIPLPPSVAEYVEV